MSVNGQASIDTFSLSFPVPNNTSSWQFTDKPIVMHFSNTQTLSIGWQQPEPVTKISGRYTFTYILLARGTTGRKGQEPQDWIQVLQVGLLYLYIYPAGQGHDG